MRYEAGGLRKPKARESSCLKPHPSSLLSDAGGIRTRNREGLSFAAVPVRVPRHALVVRVGLEPTNTEV